MTEAGKKWLQLLQETVPAATEFAVLINPTSPNLAEAQTKDLQAAARVLNLQVHVLNASTDREFDVAFAKIAELRNNYLYPRLSIFLMGSATAA